MTLVQAVSRRSKSPAGIRSRDWVLGFAVFLCAAVVLLALIGPLISPHDPLQVDQLNPYASPSPSHPLGTDDLGRDLLSRLLHGARLSTAGPALVVLVAATVGTVVALLAAWFGGGVDTLVTRCLDLVASFPALLMAIVVAAAFGKGFIAPVLALSIAYIPFIARVLRPVFARERNLPYVAAMSIQGISGWKASLFHVLPNVAPLILVQATLIFGSALLDLAALSFLGLGFQPPTPEWGVMASNGQGSVLAGFPQQSIYASSAVAISVVAFNLLGERLSQRFEGKGR
ncbi:ABC transporter permease [Streptomyces thinghirensis]|uniref:ABC transporter permease n=1 Tax=Streptomyces thinghirensis TaxID=551547 RepID=A0ABP9T4B2_9ACTN